jgi:hypothetical protein
MNTKNTGLATYRAVLHQVSAASLLKLNCKGSIIKIMFGFFNLLKIQEQENPAETCFLTTWQKALKKGKINKKLY